MVRVGLAGGTEVNSRSGGSQGEEEVSGLEGNNAAKRAGEVYSASGIPHGSGRSAGRDQGNQQAPMSLPALQPPCPSADSSARILKDASGVEPGWVEIMPRKRVTDQVRTWLLSAQTKEQRESRTSGLAVVPAQSDPPGTPAGAPFGGVRAQLW